MTKMKRRIPMLYAAADGTWLVKGSMSLERFRELFADAPAFSGESSGDYRIAWRFCNGRTRLHRCR